MAGQLDTPKPSGLTPVEASTFTWHVDALVDRVSFPPRSCLNRLMAVLGPTEQDSVRASSDGVTFYSREPFFIAGTSLEHMTYRPQLGPRGGPGRAREREPDRKVTAPRNPIICDSAAVSGHAVYASRTVD